MRTINCPYFFVFVATETIDLFYDKKKRKGDNNEADERIDEETVVEGWCADGLGGDDGGVVFSREINEKIGKIHFIEDKADRGHDDVFDK